jgi:hypothetical protein
MMPLWSITLFENAKSVATCKSYELAPVAGFQVSVGVVETFVAPSAGEINVTCPGGGPVVVKLHTEDQSLVPPL